MTHEEHLQRMYLRQKAVRQQTDLLIDELNDAIGKMHSGHNEYMFFVHEMHYEIPHRLEIEYRSEFFNSYMTVSYANYDRELTVEFNHYEVDITATEENISGYIRFNTPYNEICFLLGAYADLESEIATVNESIRAEQELINVLNRSTQVHYD